jgi:4,5-DOPA dioxygenase extradiol
MPAAFLGHGNPMNALAHNRYTEAWRAFGDAVGRPRAILVISAHWYVNATAVTAMPRPRTIHDFYGFPDELFAVDYPAPGAPDVAAEVSEIVKPQWLGLDYDSWGIDHGTWSVLCHAFPTADIPVLQLSINETMPMDYHLDLAARLAPLRERGVLVVGSGNIVHNLHRIDWRHPDVGFDWAQRFDDAAREILLDKPGNVLSLQAHQDYDAAVPTPDHFIPMLYLAAIADAAGEAPEVLVDGYAHGSLSMTAYTVGVTCPQQQDASTEGSVPLPDPQLLPPEETNA